MSAPRRPAVTRTATSHHARRPVGLATAALVTSASLVGLGFSAPAVAQDGKGGADQSHSSSEAGGQSSASKDASRQGGSGKAGASKGSANKGSASKSRSNTGKGNDNSGQGSSNAGQGNPGKSSSGQGNPGQGNPDPGSSRGKGRDEAPGQGNPNPGRGPAEGSSSAGQTAGSSGPAPAQAGPSKAQEGSKGDPAGNNGTIKITPSGEDDGIPQNSPHQACTFDIEWYGFDEGDDVVSTVSFASQAPTRDAGLQVVSGSTSVPVGGDAASGAGTDTGLDASETYQLGFTGEPHPKQGYHVKVTVSTPRSKGNDTKTKVFWVQPCDAAAPTVPGTDGGDDDGTTGGGTVGGGTVGGGTVEPSLIEGEVVAGGSVSSEGDTSSELSGAQLPGEGAVAADAGAGAAPDAVDAGLSDSARTTLTALAVAAAGLLVAAGALLARRRTVRP